MRRVSAMIPKPSCWRPSVVARTPAKVWVVAATALSTEERTLFREDPTADPTAELLVEDPTSEAAAGDSTAGTGVAPGAFGRFAGCSGALGTAVPAAAASAARPSSWSGARSGAADGSPAADTESSWPGKRRSG